ncbi:MAG: DUF4157 domain-containing protein [Deltaproteobacteria bacterium]|nr:DUF4157 domain-containing protein [Deltaproteobacteria bacterium]MCW5803707.1 DUF4157 domain-containing protein [Deltaproteobacteria bacterium]
MWDAIDNAEFPAGGMASAFRGLAQNIGAIQRSLAAEYEASVQRRGGAGERADGVQRAAAHGISGSSGPLPFLDQIQRSFGAHDVSTVKAHTDATAAAGAKAMGAEAYATGDHVVFAGAPSLHTAAHEAAHTVQQRAGVQLKGGIGEAGDAYEQHADAVADRVVQGKSAEDLLDAFAPRSAKASAGGAVQGKATGTPSPAREAKDPNTLITSDTASLLLRDLAQSIATARREAGPGRGAELVGAALKADRATSELVALTRIDPIEWPTVGAELTAASSAMLGLAADLARLKLDGVSATVVASRRRLERIVDPATWKQSGEGGASTVALTVSERAELARQAIAAARRQVGVVLAHNDRDNLAILCEPIRIHLVTAEDAVSTIAADERAELTADVEKLSSDLSKLDERLTRTPEVPWHENLATMFDAERELARHVLGNKAKELKRGYTGTVDPKKAGKDLVDAAKESAPTGRDVRAADVPAAVKHVAIALQAMHEQRTQAIDNLAMDLKEEWAPPRSTVFDNLVDIVIATAFAAVTGGIGSLVADRFKKVLEKAHGAKVAQELEGLTDAKKKLVGDKLKSSGALGRTVAADAAKDGSKEMFKRLASSSGPKPNASDSNAGDMRNFFFQQHKRLLASRGKELALEAANLATPLARLELPVLQALIDELNGLADVAHQLEYDVALREWEKFRVTMGTMSPGTSTHGDPNLDGRGETGAREDAISGLIEIGAQVDLDSDTRLRVGYVHLRHGEPAAVRRLRSHPQPLTAFHRKIYLHLLGTVPVLPRPLGAGGIVTIGIGADAGFQPTSLSRGEIEMLKAYLAGRRSGVEIWQAEHASPKLRALGERSVADERAIAFARELATMLDHLTTAQLVDPHPHA